MMATRLFPAAQFNSIEGCKLANRQAGQHWFDADTLRFFASRISHNLYRTPDGGALFVSSEQYRSSRGSAPRRYTLRRILRNGHVETVGEFQQYASGSGAHKAAARTAATMDAGDVPVSCALCDRAIDAGEWRAVIQRDVFHCHDCSAKRA